MPSDSVKEFLDTVCRQIHWRHWRRAVRTELAAHLEDRIAYLVSSRGYTQEEAAQQAVQAMGDPIEIGQALARQHRPWKSLAFLLVTLLFWAAICRVLYQLLRAIMH